MKKVFARVGALGLVAAACTLGPVASAAPSQCPTGSDGAPWSPESVLLHPGAIRDGIDKNGNGIICIKPVNGQGNAAGSDPLEGSDHLHQDDKI